MTTQSTTSPHPPECSTTYLRLPSFHRGAASVLPWLLALAISCSVTATVRAEAMLQLFNLTWSQVTEKIPEIAEAGYTSLWLPPPAKASGGYSVGYDLFDPFDLGDRDQRGTVRTRYGTRSELQQMVRLAHRFGLRVYFDNIMNHRAFDVPGYNQYAPTNLYPGMVPGDFHLQTTADGFFRNTWNVDNWNDPWRVQNLSLFGLVDIAHENPNANFGPALGHSAPKPVLVRQPGNPEFYDFNAVGVRVGFGQVNAADLATASSVYQEDVNAYLLRNIRWTLDVTQCDGFRLDAVKHVPSYFFGQQTGTGREQSSAGYLGQAQLQYNLTHGFTDANHRDSNFDPERARDDALLFGEHLGEPPGYGEYVDAGMRLLDNPLRNHLNNVLGNPSATLTGLDQRDFGGFNASVRVMHAQSHDNDYAARRELQNAFYFLREGIPLIYTDGYNEESGSPPFPRHANAAFLGQFGDNKMPDLAWLHHQLARGGTRARWSDADLAVFERYDFREGSAGAPQDQTVVLFVMNDNYGSPGDISFDDTVPQSDAGMPSTCYPVVNSRGVGLVVGFPPGSRLRQLADSPGDNRACSILLVRQATNLRSEAEGSMNDPDPVKRKVFVGGQALAPNGGAIEFKIPSGSYVCYGYQWPEPSRVDATLTNAAGQVADTDVIVLRQNGRVVPRVLLYRTDGVNGDPGFNPLYPFKMRGSVNTEGNVATGQNFSNRTYSIRVPVVTNAGPLDILVRTDGSSANTLLKLDGGVDLNSHLSLGPLNTTTHGVLDLRDNKPGAATDVFLSYEQMQFRFRRGPEKFAARLVSRNTVHADTAETYAYVVGPNGTNYVLNGDGFGAGYPEATCAWVYHDPAADTTMAGQADGPQRGSTEISAPVDVFVKVGYQSQINRCRLYYTTDGSEPLGAFGVGRGTTQVATGSFVADDASDGTIDWWKATIPAQPVGTPVKYRIGLHAASADPVIDYADAKYYALTQFEITNWNPASAKVWLHNDLATNQLATGLAEGFHLLRARVFLPRDNKSSVFNTFLQTFYYDVEPPDGAIAFPAADGDTLRSVDYGCVVRADETASEVEYNIQDSDPNNDDAVTGFANGNGLSNGVPVFARAALVTASPALEAGYPNLPKEFRFTYPAVPSNGSATLTVRVKEITSATFTNHFRPLVRTVNCAAPPQTLNIAFPNVDGQNITLNQSNSYEIVTCFSETLTADANLFTIFIDGALQQRMNANGQANYHFAGSYCGPGKRDLRYTWTGMSSGGHFLQVLYHGDGLNLQATRLVNVTVSGVTDSDGDGLPDTWENAHGLNSFAADGANGANGDPDGDGFANLEEYLAGTDPQDAQSLLRITRVEAGGQVVSWSSVPGRNYQVLATPAVNLPLTPISAPLTAFTGTTSFTNTAPAGTNLFYRVQFVP